VSCPSDPNLWKKVVPRFPMPAVLMERSRPDSVRSLEWFHELESATLPGQMIAVHVSGSRYPYQAYHHGTSGSRTIFYRV
jgi:hypothetical protein